MLLTAGSAAALSFTGIAKSGGTWKIATYADGTITADKQLEGEFSPGLGYAYETAVYFGGRYYVGQDFIQNNTPLMYNLLLFNDSWQQVNTIMAPLRIGATSLTYSDPDATVYGIFTDAAGTTASFGTLDMTSGAVSAIATLPGKPAGIAADPAGKIYLLGADAVLYTVNKTNGTLTAVGATAITLADGLRDLCYDPASSALCYVASDGAWSINPVTAAATRAAQFDGSTQWTGIFFKAAESAVVPSWVDKLAANFTRDSLSGNITFNMPTTDENGNTISGTMEYQVWTDGTDKISGQATAGQAVAVPVTVAETGMHNFRVLACRNGVNGMDLQLQRFIGHDTPKAPASATINKSGGMTRVIIGWPAVTEGVNNGYIDTEAITYTVVRQPGNVVVATGLTQNGFTDTTISSMDYYHYEITATDGVKTSDAVSTPSRLIGEEVGVIPTWEYTFAGNGLGLFTTDDSNGDGYTWRYSENDKVVWMQLNPAAPADDWLITPNIRLEKGKHYRLKIDISGSIYHEVERVEIKYGDQPLPSAMTHTALKTTEFVGSTPFNFFFTAETDGMVYLGIHAVSAGGTGAILVNSFRIEAGVDGRSPGKPAQVTATPAPPGAPAATVMFTVPVTDFEGNTLADAGTATVTNTTTGRNLPVTEAVTPGARLSVTDNAPADGLNEYTVVCANTYGKGTPATASCWVGRDIPAAPGNVRWVQEGDAAVISWDTPTRGEHNGYVDFDDMEYIVYHRETESILYRGSERRVEIRPQFSGQQDLLRFYVAGVYSDGTMGTLQTSNYTAFGTPYELPLRESFTRGGTGTAPWKLTAERGNNTWYALTDLPDVALRPFDNDEGMLVYTALGTGTSRLETPLLNFLTAEKPAVKLWYYMFDANTRLQITGSADSGNTWQTFAEVTSPGEPQWRLLTVDVGDLAGFERVQLAIQGTSSAPGAYVVVDNITIDEAHACDPMVTSLSLPSKIQAGSDYTATVTVANNGAETLSGYTVEIWHDDVLAGTATGPELAPDAIATVEVTAHMSSNAREATATVWVRHPDDADETNSSLQARCNVVPSYLPAPLDLENVAQGGESVELQWTAPANEYTAPLTDDFEDYEAGSLGGIDVTYNETTKQMDARCTTGALGRLKLVDGDHYATGTLFNMSDLPHSQQGMVCQVLDVDAFGLDKRSTLLAAHSGSKFLCFWIAMDRSNPVDEFSVNNDDWLITPELSADDKRLSLWAKSITNKYGYECFDLMVSATGDDPSDFRVFKSVKNILPGYATAPDAGYTFYEFDLPADTRYAAIHYNAKGTVGLLIDDLTYTPASNHQTLRLIGYNIYRNDELINDTPVTTTRYTDIPPVHGRHGYVVTALFDKGESPYSNMVMVKTSAALNDTATDSAAVRATAEGIEVTAPAGGLISVYTPAGRLAAQQRADVDVTAIALPQGIYIVAIDGITAAKTVVTK